MAEKITEIMNNVKRFILSEFLPHDDIDSLDDNAPLITSAILDSIATLKLVTYLEEQYSMRFEAHEISVDYLDTIAAISATVQEKLAAKT